MKISLLFLMLFLLMGGPVLAELNPNQMAGWKAGVSRVIITPEEPLWMAGYAARTTPAQGKIQDLWAKALFLQDASGHQALLITTDLLSLTKEMAGRIRSGLREKTGLSDAAIMLSCSHTHSGPAVKNALQDIYPLTPEDELRIDRYTDQLISKLVELGVNAKQQLKPASLWSANGVVRFQVNRRHNREALIAGLHELKGPNDFAVPVLKVTDEQGKPMAIAFGYACHPTTLNGYDWSGDYPGFAQEEVEKMFAGATALFFQGTGADQNPMPRRTVALARQYGKELAAAVERVIAEEMKPLDPAITAVAGEVNLPFDTLPSQTELLKMEKELKGHEKRWAARQLEFLKSGAQRPEYYPYPVQVWKLGQQWLFGLGGEVLVDYAIQLKKIFGEDIFVMGYANDGVAYIPGESSFPEGGYEVKGSPMVYGLPAPWKPGLQSLILAKAVDLAYQAGAPQTAAFDKKVKEIMKNVTEQLPGDPKNRLTAKPYFSGFDLAHDTYNAISAASDGKIYYVLSSQPHDVAGQMHVFDPVSDKTSFIGDLTEICGEKDKKAIAQGKSHVRFFERKGKLHFSTHVGFYEMIDGMECLPVNAPKGYGLYPGGHFLSYDLATGRFEDLGLAPEGEGVLTMTMDTVRNQIYAITWPKGYLVHLDLNNGKMKNLGKVSHNGEAGKVGADYRVLCRSMVVDPRDGSVYYSTADGELFRYAPAMEKPVKLQNLSLKLDYFGNYDPTRPGSMGYNWRAIVWYEKENVAYGVHGNSGYLFRFDPKAESIEIVERITSEPSRKSGMFDQFSYGYLGFDLGPDRETIHYLTGGPIYIDGKRVKGVNEIAMGAARGLENLHLVTYHIPTGRYEDHGPIFYADGSRPTYVNSIAIARDGSIYTLARFEREGKIIEDLVKITAP